MAIIGKLTKQTDGSFKGDVVTLTISRKVTMRPVEVPTERGPKYRLFAGFGEVGAAFEQSARDTGQVYLSIKLDDPSFPAPIYLAAFGNKEKPDDLDLVWSRSKAE